MPKPEEKSDNEPRIGATAEFAYDRMTVERFRAAFPRARWNEEQRRWFVPGKTASKRIAQWLARERESLDLHADAKGRDAYAFEPIASQYLQIAEDIHVRTPYSKDVIEHLRAIPWARWDDEIRAWRVPFRSYEALRRSWPEIEAAARRSEPAEQKRRQEQERLTPKYERAKLRYGERRRRRYPVPTEGLPPIGRAVMTSSYGVVIITDVTGELAEPGDIMRFYPHVAGDPRDFVWARWRPASLEELVATWPARERPNDLEKGRGWWRPSLDELRIARSQARSLERKKQRRISRSNEKEGSLAARPGTR
ncbi:hypothetical protein AC244_13620 [Ensifer adhaerens]|uniref:HARP domain-containing protein n=1 Tax=Ensifer adhaerens TaxID=106592 RepID=A0A0L8BUM1_ENSAD|nr:hypothetical protein [Ensifer adhaerens]KOF18412.1 hypothetical protein AC244_13620 [Ensifer adhaerens]